MISATLTSLRILFLAFMLLAVALAPARADATQPLAMPNATISGSVVDRDGSIPVSGATIDLVQVGKVVATTTSDKYGVFKLPAVPPGTYSIVVRAQGYGTVNSDAVLVSSGTQNLTLVVQRTETAGAVRTIGRVVVASHSVGLQTTTTIQAVADPKLAQRTNQIRMAETIGKLPEVTLIGQDSSVGDDIAVDIRGLKPSETQVMLDGHPIGPLGVYPGSIGGGSGGFNFQDSPLSSIESTLLTYGSGAVGLYGVDAIGGSVDMQTLNPTLRPAGQVMYGIAEQGKQVFGVQATGTSQKIGYAMVYGVTGTYGDFPGAVISQTGDLGNDFRSSAHNNSTYWVGANYSLRNFLAKARYAFSPSSSLTLTAYSATSWDDKTGNGDNDFISSEFSQYQAQTNPNCTTPSGAPGITVKTDTGTPCITAQQYGKQSSGPAGGGPTAWQALANQDYHARFLTSVGKNQIVLDGFTDNYSQNKQRTAQCEGECPGVPADILYLNPSLSVTNPVYRTFGGLISDDIPIGNNDIGFGYYQQRQYTTGFAINGSGTPPYFPTATLFSKLQSYFVRDAWTPSQQLSLFLNAWEKDSNLGGWSFDPRLSVVYRPEGADVIRLTGGSASADAAPIAPELASIGGVTPGNCSQIGIGTLPSPGALPEKATDLEISIAHREVADTITQFTAYDTNERNTIFEFLSPAGPFTSLINTFGGPGYIQAVINKITPQCPNFTPSNPMTIDNMFVDSNINLANARARGYNLSQRFRVNPHLVFDGYWDVQSTTFFDAPDQLLMDNPTLIQGSQLPGIPLHKWGIYGNLTNNTGGELYLNYTQVDSNNSLHRVSYGSADLAITQQIGKTTFANLGVSNLFNQAVDNYGRIGLGVYIPENQFGTDPNAVAQGSERFGLTPALISFTVIERI